MACDCDSCVVIRTKDPVSLALYARSPIAYVRVDVIYNQYTLEETILDIINNETHIHVFDALMNYSKRLNVSERLFLMIRAICLLRRF